MNERLKPNEEEIQINLVSHIPRFSAEAIPHKTPEYYEESDTYQYFEQISDLY